MGNKNPKCKARTKSHTYMAGMYVQVKARKEQTQAKAKARKEGTCCVNLQGVCMKKAKAGMAEPNNNKNKLNVNTKRSK